MIETMKRALRKCPVDGGGEDLNELVSYIAMGCGISEDCWVKFIVYNFCQEPHLPKHTAAPTSRGARPAHNRGPVADLFGL